jgi:hypothetical protein
MLGAPLSVADTSFCIAAVHNGAMRIGRASFSPGAVNMITQCEVAILIDSQAWTYRPTPRSQRCMRWPTTITGLFRKSQSRISTPLLTQAVPDLNTSPRPALLRIAREVVEVAHAKLSNWCMLGRKLPLRLALLTNAGCGSE